MPETFKMEVYADISAQWPTVEVTLTDEELAAFNADSSVPYAAPELREAWKQDLVREKLLNEVFPAYKAELFAKLLALGVGKCRMRSESFTPTNS